MYDQLKARIAELLVRPQPMKAQTERQLLSRMNDFSASLPSFLLCANEVLEEFEVEIMFAAQFTPSLDQQAEVSEALYHWKPTDEEIERLVPDLVATVSSTTIQLPDDTVAELPLHEVMIERYVKLLRLRQAPEASVMATMREGLPASLWPLAGALLRQRGFTPDHQDWFAKFVNHMASRHSIGRGMLEVATQFVSEQRSLEREELLEGAEAYVKASRGAAAYVEGGHNYWSPDVAQHHHYRGQGNIDSALVAQKKDEAMWMETIYEDLQTYDESQYE